MSVTVTENKAQTWIRVTQSLQKGDELLVDHYAMLNKAYLSKYDIYQRAKFRSPEGCYCCPTAVESRKDSQVEDAMMRYHLAEKGIHQDRSPNYHVLENENRLLFLNALYCLHS